MRARKSISKASPSFARMTENPCRAPSSASSTSGRAASAAGRPAGLRRELAICQSNSGVGWNAMPCPAARAASFASAASTAGSSQAISSAAAEVVSSMATCTLPRVAKRRTCSPTADSRLSQSLGRDTVRSSVRRFTELTCTASEYSPITAVARPYPVMLRIVISIGPIGRIGPIFLRAPPPAAHPCRRAR